MQTIFLVGLIIVLVGIVIRPENADKAGNCKANAALRGFVPYRSLMYNAITKVREIMKPIVFAACICLLVSTLVGCSDVTNGNDSGSLHEDGYAADSNGEETTDSAAEETAEKEKGFYCDAFGNYVFDFAELSEEGFPRGTWTVNQLIEKYGIPEKCIASYYLIYGTYGVVSVSLAFKGFAIGFDYENPDSFSFYAESLSEGDYGLSDEDKDLKLDVLSLVIAGEEAELPFGISIGHSSKTDVIDAYPVKDPYTLSSDEPPYHDSVFYDYAFLDEAGNLPEDVSITDLPDNTIYQTGHIAYIFDENEVLQQAEVQWRFADL